ncbi:protein MTL1-like [Leptopilina heterotoma]|uniref:protein MTL1-like n=1 Tax=Leptopilina heterotoma TaxID=63436 RepID=UPI001CA8210A|nr:protein MTL1-like [Leptopilina heterotoma]
MDFLRLYNYLDGSFASEDEGIGDNRLQCYIGKIYEIRQVTEEKRLLLIKSLELEDTVPNDANLYIRVDDNILNIGQVAYSWITKDAEAIHRTESIYMNSSTRNLISIGMDVFADDVPCSPTRIEKESFDDMMYDTPHSLQLERDANPFEFHSPLWRPNNPEPHDEPNYEDFDFSLNVGSLALYERMERDAFFDNSESLLSQLALPAFLPDSEPGLLSDSLPDTEPGLLADSEPDSSPAFLPDSEPVSLTNSGAVSLPNSGPVFLPNSEPDSLENLEPEAAMVIEMSESSDEDEPSSSSTPVSSPTYSGSGAARTTAREPKAVKPVPLSLSISFSSLALGRLGPLPLRSISPTLRLAPSTSRSVPSTSRSVPSTSSSVPSTSRSVPSRSVPSTSSSVPSTSRSVPSRSVPSTSSSVPSTSRSVPSSSSSSLPPSSSSAGASGSSRRRFD